MTMSMMMKMTTLKLNLGQPMILYPRVTCIIAFAPSTVALTHQRASSSSPILGHTHSATLVRSHSHPFPESNDQVEDLRVPDHWLVPTIALQESEWLRVTLHKWLDDEYCPEETNVEISRVAAKSYYNSLLQKQTDLGDILLNMARELESISYKESFHGAFSSANAAVNLIAQRIEQLWKVFVLVGAGGAVRALAYGAKSRGARVVVFNRNYEQKLLHMRSLGKLFHMSAYELVFDAVYTPQKALALQKASRAGAIVVSGVEVFIRQALGQFRLYTGGLAPEDLLGPYIVKES